VGRYQGLEPLQLVEVRFPPDLAQLGGIAGELAEAISQVIQDDAEVKRGTVYEVATLRGMMLRSGTGVWPLPPRIQAAGGAWGLFRGPRDNLSLLHDALLANMVASVRLVMGF
jgi:hypothetical protein